MLGYSTRRSDADYARWNGAVRFLQRCPNIIENKFLININYFKLLILIIFEYFKNFLTNEKFESRSKGEKNFARSLLRVQDVARREMRGFL